MGHFSLTEMLAIIIMLGIIAYTMKWAVGLLVGKK